MCVCVWGEGGDGRVMALGKQTAHFTGVADYNMVSNLL